MYQYGQAPHQQLQLPFPIDAVDQSTLRNGLPHANDVFPPISIPPNLHGDLVTAIANEFRTIVQNFHLGKSPIHTFLYNVLSQNYFNNQEYAAWVQRAADFAEFLMVAQRNTPQVAVSKAVARIYTSALTDVASRFPQLLQTVDAGLHTELVQASRDWADICRDIQAFHQNGRQPVAPPMGHAPAPMQSWQGGQPAAYGMSRQLPPVHATMQNYSTQPQPMYQSAPPPMAAPMTAPSMPSTAPGAGRYAADAALTNRPTPSPAAPQPFEIKPPVMATPIITEDEGMAPLSPDDVEINPNGYRPKGATFDPERPYDELYAPGGVVIKPAHLSGWKWKRNAYQAYAQGYDPAKFVLFHVKFPSGDVYEKLAEWTPDMDYMRHEINDELRAVKAKPTGKIVYNSKKVIDLTGEAAVSTQVAKETYDELLMIEKELAPVELESLHGGNTDLENELAARDELIELLGLDENVEYVPAHEYHSAKVYPMDISEECFQQLLDLKTCTTLEGVAQALKIMLNAGVLPLRYYRFLDERLTAGINKVLKDNLSMGPLKIDSFMDDADDLIKHLVKKEGIAIQQLINSQVPTFIQRYLSLSIVDSDEENGVPGRIAVADEYINLQTGWRYEEIASLNLGEEAVLISSVTHPKVYKVIRALLERKTQQGRLVGRSVRLITLDGVYLEVVLGWLVEKSILIKRL